MVAMQGPEETEEDGYYKTSFSVFVAILYLKVLYILVMTLYILSRFNPTLLNNMRNLFDLCLSEWDSEEQVVVPASVVRHLKPYHYDPIRFLYKCYKDKLGGAILSQNEEMNFPVQLAAFLNAIKPIVGGRIAVLAFADRLTYWYYHLVEHSKWNVGFEVDVFEESGITLLSLCNETTLKQLQDQKFAIVIIDEFERVANKTAIRKLSGQFKIGLTSRNFTKCPDQRLQWRMLRWSNPKHVGTFESFCEIDNEHLERFIEPFTQYWQRRSWSFCDDFKKDTDEEFRVYKEMVRKWAAERNFNLLEASVKKKAVKRKSDEKNGGKGRRKIIKKGKSESEQKFENASTEDENGENEIVLKTESGLEELLKTESVENSSNSSSDTVIYEPDEKPVCHQLPSMEVSPIVQSIVEGFCRSPVKQEQIHERQRSDEILSFLFAKGDGDATTDIKEEFSDTPSNCDTDKILSELFD